MIMLDTHIAMQLFEGKTAGFVMHLRDPFDRLIVAHATILRAKLVTFDSQILSLISGSFS